MKMLTVANMCTKKYNPLLLLCFFLWVLFVFHQRSSIIEDKVTLTGTDLSNPRKSIPYTKPKSLTETDTPKDQCSGRYIYIHNLPSKFNTDIIKNCSSLLKWTYVDMCDAISNVGLGPQVYDSHGVFPNKSWYSTHQFLLEPIFHNRMNNYECLTDISSKASAVYVPFYPGLDVGRYLWSDNSSLKDSTSIQLFEWLLKTSEWERMWGIDHFFVVGRTTWDFRRQTNKDTDWGNRLMFLPQAQNITILSIESYHSVKKDIAVPYPTYFHPFSDIEVFDWQNKVRQETREYLFSFVGAPRPQIRDSLRSEIIAQCLASREKCKWHDCSSGDKCNSPISVMKTFLSSTFCLQPRGDSFTRRSAFDAIVAGCIPVFFHPKTAYEQYTWHLPKDYTKYSVFIKDRSIKNGKADIEKTLSRLSEEAVTRMREEVIRLIPKVIYANPLGRLDTMEDAFDIAVRGVLDGVEIARKEMKR